ncbi:MAG: DUF2442 domain-containing protein [Tannerella sp.]|jgi:hypothetical protein|nr:DUF2442 domain-containing protein [Tannerella sp.]
MIKIVKDYSTDYLNIPKVKTANYVKDYVLEIKFVNGERKNVDFEAFLKKSLNPFVKKYINKDNFLQFSVINGNINWNNYDMIFPVENLYTGIL